MDNMLDSGIIVNEFELRPEGFYAFTFPTNISYGEVVMV